MITGFGILLFLLTWQCISMTWTQNCKDRASLFIICTVMWKHFKANFNCAKNSLEMITHFISRHWLAVANQNVLLMLMSSYPWMKNLIIDFKILDHKRVVCICFHHHLMWMLNRLQKNSKWKLQGNDDLNRDMKDYSLLEFYKRLPEESFPKIKDLARKKMSLLGSTYICEQLFTKMKHTKSKTRSRLTDCHLENSLRVAASSIAPKIDTLEKKHQAQISH